MGKYINRATLLAENKALKAQLEALLHPAQPEPQPDSVKLVFENDLPAAVQVGDVVMFAPDGTVARITGQLVTFGGISFKKNSKSFRVTRAKSLAAMQQQLANAGFTARN